MRYILMFTIVPAIVGCQQRDQPRDRRMTPHAKVAVQFATALVNGDYAGAHALLAPPLSQQLTPEDLRKNLYGMFRLYAEGEPKRIHFDEQFDQTDWPGKLPRDVG